MRELEYGTTMLHGINFITKHRMIWSLDYVMLGTRGHNYCLMNYIIPNMTARISQEIYLHAPSRSGSLLLRVSLVFDLERGIRGVPAGVAPGVLKPFVPSFSSTGRGLSCSMLWVRRLESVCMYNIM